MAAWSSSTGVIYFSLYVFPVEVVLFLSDRRRYVLFRFSEFQLLELARGLMGGGDDGWEVRSGDEKLDVVDILRLILQEFG